MFGGFFWLGDTNPVATMGVSWHYGPYVPHAYHVVNFKSVCLYTVAIWGGPQSHVCFGRAVVVALSCDVSSVGVLNGIGH